MHSRAFTIPSVLTLFSASFLQGDDHRKVIADRICSAVARLHPSNLVPFFAPDRRPKTVVWRADAPESDGGEGVAAAQRQWVVALHPLVAAIRPPDLAALGAIAAAAVHCWGETGALAAILDLCSGDKPNSRLVHELLLAWLSLQGEAFSDSRADTTNFSTIYAIRTTSSQTSLAVRFTPSTTFATLFESPSFT